MSESNPPNPNPTKSPEEIHQEKTFAVERKLAEVKNSVLTPTQIEMLSVSVKTVNGTREEKLEYADGILNGIKSAQLDRISPSIDRFVESRKELRKEFDSCESMVCDAIASIDNDAVFNAALNSVLAMTKVVAIADKAIIEL